MFDAKKVAEILTKLYSDQYGYPVKITLEAKDDEAKRKERKNELS